MKKIIEQCVVDGELTPELIKRKQELDQLVNFEISEVEAGRGQQWQPKEKQYAEIRQKYDDIWEQELTDAGYVVRPIFESTVQWYDALSKLNETLEDTNLAVPSAADPYAEFNLSSSVEEALANFPDDYFEIRYDRYTVNWEEDSWDYVNHNHTTIPRSRRFDAFTYEVSPDELFETLRDFIIDSYIDKPGYIEKAIQHYKSGFGSWAQDRAEESVADLRKVVADYQKFQELWKTDETAGEKLDIYIADHLDDFFVLFELPLKDFYEDRAKDSRW